MQDPTIGRIVHYRSRTGNYTVPAIVTATTETLASAGVELYKRSGGEKGVPPLDSSTHVHLQVFTPGMPGMRADAQDFVGDRADEPRSENVNGSYQEWNVPLDQLPPADKIVAGERAEQKAGTWSWPVYEPPADLQS